MKRVLTLVLIFSSLMATAQQLRLTYQGNPLSDGDTIRVEYTQDDLGRDLLRPVIAFENLSESAYSGHTYAVYENVAPGHMIQFCVFGTCVANLSTSIAIELNDYSKAILDKYEGMVFPGGTALPVISNQKMNDYLKELASMWNMTAIWPPRPTW